MFIFHAGLIAEALSSDNADQPSIRVHDHNIVCETIGLRRNAFRYVSVVANYSSDGVFSISQFEFECVDTVWSPVLRIVGLTSVTLTANAALTTEPRTDCGLCASVQIAQSLQQSDIVSQSEFDSVTHCFGKGTYTYIFLQFACSYNIHIMP